MRLVLLFCLVVSATAAGAEEPTGCDKFSWDIAPAQKLLASAAKPVDGVLADRNAGTAIAVPLVPFADARLERPPERAPKDPGTFAGLVRFAAAGEPSEYTVTLDAGGWIDIVQDGSYLKPLAFSGALGCPNVRKSVRFRIGAGSFTIQLSNVASPTIDMVLLPAR